jgi:hypothetical protein
MRSPPVERLERDLCDVGDIVNLVGIEAPLMNQPVLIERVRDGADRRDDHRQERRITTRVASELVGGDGQEAATTTAREPCEEVRHDRASFGCWVLGHRHRPPGIGRIPTWPIGFTMLPV